MSELKVINLFGCPGSGKSTTAAGLFYFMKLKGYKVELVTEFPKDLVYDGTLEVMLDRQEVIFAEQNQRLHRLRGKVEYVITDSPILLSTVYPKINQEQFGVGEWDALPAFIEFVKAVHNTYCNLNYYLHRSTVYQTYGRLQDEEQAAQIDIAIRNALACHPHKSFDVDGDLVDNILNHVTTHEMYR